MTQDTSTMQGDSGSPRSVRLRWLTNQQVLSALIGASGAVVAAFVPLMIEAWRHNVPLPKVIPAREQVRLWSKNKDCLASQKPAIAPVRLGAPMNILSCPGGDVLLTRNPGSQDAQKPEVNQWISFASSQHLAASDFWMQKAVAAAVPASESPIATRTIQLAQSATVICTKSLEEGRLLRRVRDANGECWNETINTYTGTVIQRDKATCDANCS